MVLDRKDGSRSHYQFDHIINLLSGNELIVFNNTKVFPARLQGIRPLTGGKVEVLLIEPENPTAQSETDHLLKAAQWRAMVKPAKRVHPGDYLLLGDSMIQVTANHGGGEITLDFAGFTDSEFNQFLNQSGSIPLPPYIKRDTCPDDLDRYQTVYAGPPGAVAAPTAGLHFTPELLDAIRQKGCQIAWVTLHVGPGTFRPMQTERVEDHHMHHELYTVPTETADMVNQAKQEGRPVLAVGTTVVRTLESACRQGRYKLGMPETASTTTTTTTSSSYNNRGILEAGSGSTDIFIYPGFEFMIVDQLITNYHLPKSTLLLLVSAMVERETLLEAYREAVAKQYRFFSYGDSMFIR